MVVNLDRGQDYHKLIKILKNACWIYNIQYEKRSKVIFSTDQ